MSKELAKLRARLNAYLSRFMSRQEDVEDISQEAFLRVLEAESNTDIRHPKAYLYRTAKNLAISQLRSSSGQMTDYVEELLGADVYAESGQLEQALISSQHFELFCKAVSLLPEQCRRVLVYRRVYGFSQKQVADKMNISISTVEKHLTKGLRRCSAYLEAHTGESFTVAKKRKSQ